MDRAEQTERMRAQRDEGWTYERIAADHGVSPATVSRRLNPSARPRKPAVPPSSGTHVSSEAETAEMWRKWVAGRTQYELADDYGITQTSVSERLARYRKSLPETERETILRRELDVLDGMRRPLLDLIAADPPPLYNNGRAVKDADGNLVPDHGPLLAAVDRVVKLQERMAKFLGLDAPAKAEVLHVEAATEAAKAAAERATAYLAGEVH